MFDTLWKPKFVTKCKSCLKLTKMRLDSIRKKKIAVLKFLKKDIAELLKNGLDYNAYGRAEGLLVEQNILSCYDLIDKFCGIISNQLPVMNKESECLEECREAVATLIQAAARFSDFPELRDLRSLLTVKYGSSFEAFANKEFVEKSRAMPVTKEMKLQLIQEVAQESSIDWNSKALEQQLYIPPQNEPDVNRTSKNDAGFNSDITKQNKASSIPERKTNSFRRKNISDDDSSLVSSSSSSSSDDSTIETSTRDSSTDQDIRKGVSEDELAFYHRFAPPPYLKSKQNKKESVSFEPPKVIEHKDNDNDESNKHNKPVTEEKPKPKSVRRRNIRPLPNDREKIGSSQMKGDEKMISEEKSPREEEEKMLDALLIRYSDKKTSDYESNKTNKNTKAEEVETPSAREVSFPSETDLTGADHPRHNRAVSLQPDMVGHGHGHVHPKLPDYEQLAARFAALKGKY